MSNYLALLNYNLTRVNASTINYSTLTGSTMTTHTINYSTLTGSTMTNNTMTINSTINVSSITSRAINYSTLTGSTMTINTLVIASTLTVSTLIATNNPAGVITSSMISLGASTNQSYTALAQGNYSTSTNWLSTLTNLSSTKFVAMSGNAQTQLAITQISTISSIYYTSTIGTSWSTISNVTGLPIATQTNYSCGAVSGNGQYGILGTTNGNLYITSTLTSAAGPSFTTVYPPPASYIYLPFENSVTDVNGNSVVTATGSPAYVTGIVGSTAINLANTLSGTATQYVRGTWTVSPNISLSGWFRSTTVSTGSQYGVMFSAYSGNLSLYTDGPTGQLLFQFPTGSGSAITAIRTSYAIAASTWYSFFATFQTNGTCSLYVNNILIGTSTNTGGFGSIVSSGYFGLGTYENSTALAYNGYIDDFRIYTSATTYSNVAISNSGQYMLATVANGGLYMSSNFGSTWSQVTSVALNSFWQGLSISATGQYMITSQSINPVIYHPFDNSLVDVMGGSSSQFVIANGYYQNGGNSPATYPGSVSYPAGKIGSNSINVTSGAFIANYSFPITGFTVSYWLYPISGYSAQMYLSSRTVTNTGSLSGVIYWGINPTNNLYNTYSTGADFTSYATPTVTATSPMNTWCHIAIVYTPGTFTHYLNGNVACTVKFTLASPMLSYFLGQTLSGYVATCYFDDFRVYSTPLSAYHIGQIYANTVTQIPINNINLPVSSSNYGASWSSSSSVFASTTAVLSGSGQYALGNSISPGIAITTPQLSGLTGNTSSSTPVPTTWTANNIVWTSNASSVNSIAHQSWKSFNNLINDSNSWTTTVNTYTSTTGVYAGLVLTIISVPYSNSYAGEWLQIQSSVPVVLYNYTFGCGGDFNNIPKIYLIAGSNDGTSWYPIQFVNMGATNPFNATYTSGTYLLANYTGTQSLIAGATATITTTAYSTSGNAYTYFRIISNVSFGGVRFELSEWYINFTTSPYVVSNNLAGFLTSTYSAPVFSPALTNTQVASAVSHTGQYMVLITNATSGANVYYSINYGANFTGLLIGSSAMVSCAISSDGSYITVMNATTVYQLNNNSIGFSVAVGNQAGQQNQAQNAIAIGSFAGQQNQTANSIVLNATGAALNSYVPGFYVAPIQQYGASTSSSFNLLGYGSDNQIVQASVISLLSSGNVGIGITNPNAPLHVIGNINTSGNIIATNFASTDFTLGNAGYSAGKWLTLNLNNVQGTYPTSGYNIVNSLSIGGNFTGGSNEIDFMNNIGAGFHFYARTATSTATLLMSMLGSGNVGIGSTIPGYPLHLFGNANTQLCITNPNSGSVSSNFLSCIGFGPGNPVPYVGCGYDNINDAFVVGLNIGSSQLTNIGLRINRATSVGTVYLPYYSSNGTMTITTGGQISVSSDKRIKTNITYYPKGKSLSKVLQIKPATFNFINTEEAHLHLGFIAQDVEYILPYVVDGKKYEYIYECKKDANGNITTKPLIVNGEPVWKLDEKTGERIIRPRGFDDKALLAHTILALQEQNDIINALETKLDNLTKWATTQGFII